MPETTNGPRTERLGPSAENSRSADQLTACEHLARAAYWLDLAERNWNEGDIYATAAKLCELHLMLADRMEQIQACGGTGGTDG